MHVKDFLSPGCATIERGGTDKPRLLNDLARRAAALLNLRAEDVAAALLQREALGSTGMGGGVAVPHCRLSSVSEPFGMLVRLDKPINFDAIDDRKVDLVFLLLLPTATQGERLNALAAVARTLRDPETAQRLRAAVDAADLHLAMTETKRLRS
jgi:PTS system nitrogen regulatory IIA component